jgi:enolase
MKIVKVMAREIYDSRGWPTVQCELLMEDEALIISSVPTGLSRGRHEAYELRDGGKRLWGTGVLRAIENIEQIIAPGIIDKEPNGPTMDILMLDMDGTPDKSHLGANTILAVSMAVYKAQAYSENIQLYELIAHLVGADTITMPFPQFNLINGGLHGQNAMQIQEFLLVPAGSANFRAAMELGVTIFHELKNVLHKYGKSTAVGDEGGYAPQGVSDNEALSYLYEAIERVGKQEDINCVIALDCAATQFYDKATNSYRFQSKSMSATELMESYKNLMYEYPIYSLEDPLAEDDWDNWKLITRTLGEDSQIVGDDIFATNFHRIEQGIRDKVATASIIKPNQIGTITETLQAIQLCKQNELDVVISHRSGETEDTFIADLAVGTSAGQIKAGGCSRSERLAKYNRLLAIEDNLLANQQGSL